MDKVQRQNKADEARRRRLYKKHLRAKKKEEKLLQRGAIENRGVFLPAYQDMMTHGTLVGYILRVLVCVFTLHGLLLYLSDAMAYTIFSAWAIFGISAAICAVFAVGAYNRITLPITAAAVLGGGAAFLFTRPQPFVFAEKCALCLYNSVVTRLADVGYTGMAYKILEIDYGRYDPEMLLRTAFIVVAALMGLLIVACLAKRVRIVPIAILIGAILVVIFTYNITRGTWGFAMILSAICGIMVLLVHDSVYIGSLDREYDSKDPKKIKKAADKAKKAAKKAAKKEKKLKKLSPKKAEKKRKKIKKSDRIHQRAKELGYSYEDNMVFTQILTHEEEAEAAAAAELDGEENKPLSPKEKRRAARKAASARRKRYFKNAAAGGFAGIAATLLALVVISLPAALTDEYFPKIDFLNNRIAVARLYVTAWLMGDEVDLNDMALYAGLSDFGPREMGFESPQYTGMKLLEVDVDYNTPVYLRSWLGLNYDYENGIWYSATEDEITEYRKIFGVGFQPEIVTQNFYKYVIPPAISISDTMSYKNYLQNGFLMMQINIKRVSGKGYLMYMPAQMNTDYGVMEYTSREPSKLKYTSYFDGIYTSRLFIEGRSYSTISYVTSMKHPDLALNLQDSVLYYDLSRAYAERTETLKELLERAVALESGEVEYETSREAKNKQRKDPTYIPDAELFSAAEYQQILDNSLAEYDALLREYGIEYRTDSIFSRYLAMTDEEKKEYRYALIVEDYYRDYAETAYVGTTGNPEIKALAEQILADAIAAGTVGEGLAVVTNEDGSIGLTSDGYNRHQVIMAVLNYLKEHYTYTLEPTNPALGVENYEGNALETFLFDTKEGYCVHFATAATLLLRELGLPVRYAEGYVASEFYQNYTEDAPARYRSYIYDSNAHAWLEVYYPGIGWMQYEATPPFMDSMYTAEYVSSTANRPPTTAPVVVTPEVVIEDTEILTEEEDNTEFLMAMLRIGIIAAVVLIVFVVIATIINTVRKRAYEAIDTRLRLIDTAKDEEKFTDGPDSHLIARKISDMILAIYEGIGNAPEKGELPSEYAKRLSAEYENLSSHDINDIIMIMEKEEFGYGLTYRELYKLADYLRDISLSVYSGLGKMQQLRLRFIKRIL